MAFDPNRVLARPMFGVANVAGVTPSATTPSIDLRQRIGQGIGGQMGAGAAQRATGSAPPPVQVASASAPPPLLQTTMTRDEFIAENPREKWWANEYFDEGERLTEKEWLDWRNYWNEEDEDDEEAEEDSPQVVKKEVSDLTQNAEIAGAGLRDVLRLEEEEISTSLERPYKPDIPAEKQGIATLDETYKKITESAKAPKTPEEYNEDAKKILGAEGEKDVPDWALPLMQFGLALMSTPGPVTQAIGIAGQKALPAFAAARKARKAEQRTVGLLARDLKKEDVAARVAAIDRAIDYGWKEKELEIRIDTLNIQKEAATLKGDQFTYKKELDAAKRAFNVKKLITESSLKVISELPEKVRMPFLAAFTKTLGRGGIFSETKNVKSDSPEAVNQMHMFSMQRVAEELKKKDPLAWLQYNGYSVGLDEEDWVTKTVVYRDEHGRELEGLGKLNTEPYFEPRLGEDGKPVFDEKGDPVGKTWAPLTFRQILNPRDGKIVAKGNADPNTQKSQRVMWDPVNEELRRYNGIMNLNPYTDETGKSWISGGNWRKVPNDEGAPVGENETIWTMTMVNGQPTFRQITAKNAGKLSGSFIAKEARQDLIDQHLAVTSLTRMTDQLLDYAFVNEQATAITTRLGGFVDAGVYLTELGKAVGTDFGKAALNSFGIFKNFGPGGDPGGVIGGVDITSKSKAQAAGNNLTAGYLTKIAGVEFSNAAGDQARRLNPEEMSALEGLSALKGAQKSLIYNLAYAVARTNEPGGRLTDRDIANALITMGVSGTGTFSPASLKASLTNLVAERQNQIVDRYNSNIQPLPGDVKQPDRYQKNKLFGPESIYKNTSVYNVIPAQIFEPPGDGEQLAPPKVDFDKLPELYPNLAKEFLLEGESGRFVWNQPGVVAKFDKLTALSKSDEFKNVKSGDQAAIMEELNRLTGLIQSLRQPAQ